MSDAFEPRHGPIVVKAEVTGPANGATVRLILDTGATTSLLEESVLIALGYDLASVTDRVVMATGSLVTSVPRVVLTRFSALDRHRFGFTVLAHTLPASVSVHGLLGLDFLRDGVLTIDFAAGRISLV
jgi:predicted aspartyl protease